MLREHQRAIYFKELHCVKECSRLTFIFLAQRFFFSISRSEAGQYMFTLDRVGKNANSTQFHNNKQFKVNNLVWSSTLTLQTVIYTVTCYLTSQGSFSRCKILTLISCPLHKNSRRIRSNSTRFHAKSGRSHVSAARFHTNATRVRSNSTMFNTDARRLHANSTGLATKESIQTPQNDNS